ncbi:hypothetical protein [uncultured Tateyamaria sp.]|uniref:hypothetical protein n=1 Tax=uncultured Tateyamaria sp. TaxID=455651 RepID=UPI00260F4E96|nr:hypothetical protein [uncultured Tateyamaria sp.]
MKTISLALLLCAAAACSNYREPQANCFAFVSQGPAPLDCHFEALRGPDPEDVANE